MSLSAVRWLAPWTRGLDARDLRLLHLVAALHATHPAHEPGRNLGATLARLARRRGGPADGRPLRSLERRFMALLEADGEDLAGHLRRVISLARDHGLPLDWAQLLSDVNYTNCTSPDTGQQDESRSMRAFIGGGVGEAKDSSGTRALHAGGRIGGPHSHRAPD
jgi:CRISPR type I-E-associated protein CasB/Cse2